MEGGYRGLEGWTVVEGLRERGGAEGGTEEWWSWWQRPEELCRELALAEEPLRSEPVPYRSASLTLHNPNPDP